MSVFCTSKLRPLSGSMSGCVMTAAPPCRCGEKPASARLQPTQRAASLCSPQLSRFSGRCFRQCGEGNLQRTLQQDTPPSAPGGGGGAGAAAARAARARPPAPTLASPPRRAPGAWVSGGGGGGGYPSAPLAEVLQDGGSDRRLPLSGPLKEELELARGLGFYVGSLVPGSGCLPQTRGQSAPGSSVSRPACARKAE